MWNLIRKYSNWIYNNTTVVQSKKNWYNIIVINENYLLLLKKTDWRKRERNTIKKIIFMQSTLDIEFSIQKVYHMKLNAGST